jgi:DNA-binding response OmpR family regulator
MATILIADDEPDLVATLADLLEDEGHRVLRARDGAAALAAAARDRPDHVLTDQMMPGLTGAELAAYLRARPGLAVPVILMSALPRVAVPPGVAFLPKPFDLGRLLALVDALLPGP